MRWSVLVAFVTFAAQVRLGEWNVKQQSEKLPHEDFDIESKSVHPDYNPATFQNDIAVIKLKKKVIYKEHIIPVSTAFCLLYFTGLRHTWGRNMPVVTAVTRFPVSGNFSPSLTTAAAANSYSQTGSALSAAVHCIY